VLRFLDDYRQTTKMSWKKFHSQESEKEYFKKLQEKLDYLYSDDIKFFTNVYPPRDLIFRCFDETPLDQVRVVILGQDPYHQKGQANGLAFAVNEGITSPPSLKNIMKESKCTDPTLVKWAKQGVLLLNTTLTVKESSPMSCSKIGWETYTNNALEYLVENSNADIPLIFCLWGAHAQSKKLLLKKFQGVEILEASHPSPLSAHISFIGCGHFDKINEILESYGQPPIVW
jgi:uracil-DNA glycosylase